MNLIKILLTTNVPCLIISPFLINHLHYLSDVFSSLHVLSASLAIASRTGLSYSSTLLSDSLSCGTKNVQGRGFNIISLGPLFVKWNIYVTQNVQTAKNSFTTLKKFLFLLPYCLAVSIPLCPNNQNAQCCVTSSCSGPMHCDSLTGLPSAATLYSTPRVLSVRSKVKHAKGKRCSEGKH